jgi:hypothetical protein
LIAGFFYVYFSQSAANAMRVSRFTFTATNIANSEVVLFTDSDGLQGKIYHFGGDIQFGPGLPSCLSLSHS